MATHAGMTTEEFEKIVKDWIATAKHPKTKRPYTEMVYQPMLELLAYLRANGFKTFIVSGGGIEFMRAVDGEGLRHSARAGRRQQRQAEVRDARRQAGAREAAGDRLHRRQGRQAGRHQQVHRPPADRRVRQFRRRPADAAMDRRRQRRAFLGLVHHTDAEREWAYDRKSHIGQLDKALDEAKAKGWTVVDMKDDWKTYLPQIIEASAQADRSAQIFLIQFSQLRTTRGSNCWRRTFRGGVLTFAAQRSRGALQPVSAQTTGALDRTVLPIPEPKRPTITELDARNAKAPPRFEVKAPQGAPNVVIVLIDDIGFGQPSTFGGPIHMPTLEQLADERAELQPLPHHRALLADARRAHAGRNHHATTPARSWRWRRPSRATPGSARTASRRWPRSCG